MSRNVCQSCLEPLTVETDVGFVIPCCRSCWSEIPVSVRLKLASEIQALKATENGWEHVRKFFAAAQAGELQRISPFDVGNNMRN